MTLTEPWEIGAELCQRDCKRDVRSRPPPAWWSAGGRYAGAVRAVRPEWERVLLPAAVISLTVLLVVLAVLQYRWIGEIGQAERERLRGGLEAAVDRAAGEVEREISRVWLAFQPSPNPGPDRRGELARQLRAWRRAAATPRLIVDVLLVVRRDGEEDPVLERLDEASGRFVPIPWPEDLRTLWERLRRPPEEASRLALPPPGSMDAGLPALILPLMRLERGGPGFDRREVAVARLDRRLLADKL